MKTYRIADLTVAVEALDKRAWTRIEWRYAPFIVPDNISSAIDSVNPGSERLPVKPDLMVTLLGGEILSGDSMSTLLPDDETYSLVFSDTDVEPGAVRTDFWRDATGNLRFDIQSPQSSATNGRLYINKELDNAFFVLVNAKNRWIAETVTTCAMQLAYMVTGAHLHLLMSHSSCVVVDGKSYLFIGKSGTGKSTHSLLWLENISGATLLNDDHPIVRVGDKVSIAYGSPWSGKTDCYVNAQAPIAAIVRIKQAPHNRIRRQSPIEAYASLISSFSGLTMIPQFADSRHADIERLVMSVPCYELECLPNADAAALCYNELNK